MLSQVVAGAIAYVSVEQVIANLHLDDPTDRALEGLREFMQPHPQVAKVYLSDLSLLRRKRQKLVDDLADRDPVRLLGAIFRVIFHRLREDFPATQLAMMLRD